MISFEKKRNFLVVFSTEKSRGNYPYQMSGRLTIFDILKITRKIAEEFNHKTDSIIIENIIELK